LLTASERHKLESAAGSVAISAQTGEGLEDLRRQITEILAADLVVEADFELSAADGKQLALLHRTGTVVSTQYQEGKVLVRARVPESVREMLKPMALEALLER